MSDEYYEKYMKYKLKYLELKNGGGNVITKALENFVKTGIENLQKDLKNLKPEDVKIKIKQIKDNYNKIPENIRTKLVINNKSIIDILDEIEKNLPKNM
jgi:hypothetical protein